MIKVSKPEVNVSSQNLELTSIADWILESGANFNRGPDGSPGANFQFYFQSQSPRNENNFKDI